MDLGLSPHHRQTAGTDYPMNAPQAPNIGNPVTFETGQFAGRTIRVELSELQKAQSGRKYAKVDRRPLDPPPTVHLRLFEIVQQDQEGNWEESELLYENVLNVGLMCTVDLFPVPESSYEPGSPSSLSPGFSHSPGIHNLDPRTSQQQNSPMTYFPLHPYMSVEARSSQTPTPPFQIPRRQLMLGTVNPYDIPSDVVYRIGNHYITESSKLTPALVGEKFMEPTLVDYNDRKALVFVFGDIAVQREGVFILRYRVFDLYSGVPGNPHAPVLAELYGGPFKVYSTREFPGLEPSTELTKNLSKYGVRVTLRDAERKSKRRSKE